MEKAIQINNVEETQFQAGVQRLLNWFVFFVIYPAVDIGGISITFYIFFAIIYQTKKSYGYVFRLESYIDLIPVLLGFVFLLSYLMAEQGYVQISLFSDLKLLVQYFYWLLILSYFSTWAAKINFLEISKYLFFGLIAITLSQYVLSRIGFFPKFTQNSYIFTIITCGPISFYYLYKRYNFPVVIFFAIVLFISALLSQSRAGSILVFLQVILVISFVNPAFKKFVILSSIMALPLMLIAISELSSDEGRAKIAQVVEAYNPRIAELLEDPEKVTFRDKSWLTRQMMINKGLKINEEFPWLGVGIGRFNKYWVDIERINKWSNDSMAHYNERSSHNSYIQLLAESGQVGLALFILLLLGIFLYGIKYFFLLRITPAIFIMAGFIGMVIHLWAIASLTGTNTWFLLGLGIAVVKDKFS